LSPRVVGRISAVLFVLCGALVALLAPILPYPAAASRPGLAVVASAAVVSGAVIWSLPWNRWPRLATLWLVPVATTLVVLHNVFSGLDGFAYGLFFMVIFVWIGLGHPQGTSLALSPMLAIAYLVPLIVLERSSSIAIASAAYAMPCGVLIGETVTWVAERLRRSDRALRSSEERFRSLVEESADVVVLMDAEGRTVFASPSLTRVLGYRPDDWLGHTPDVYVHPDDQPALDDTWPRLVSEPGSIARYETQVRSASGEYRWCAVVLRNLLTEPAVNGVVANFTDITERMVAREELAESETTFRRLFEANPQPMWVHDRQTLGFLAVNDAAVEHYGYSRAQFLAMSLRDLDAGAPPEVPDGRTVDRCRPARHRLGDGQVVDVELTSNPIAFRDRAAMLTSVQDVTTRVALEQQLRHQAFHDPLTGLANRALFYDRLQHALARIPLGNAGLAVLLLDIDAFKRVNDSLGHTSGDELLVAVSQRLAADLRPADTAARLGGDEFVVLAEGLTDPSEATALAERLQGALTAPFHLAGREVVVRASIGIASAGPGDTATAEELLRNADVAMYAAKADGHGGHARFQAHMHADAVARLEVESELRTALGAGRLELYYQPIVQLPGREIVGAEGLIRWHHPTRGLVMPGQFIPVAEQTGLIDEIGAWVIAQACNQLARWQDTGGPQEVAVNVSARQLASARFVSLVRSCLATSGASPVGLTLEITESVVMADPDAARIALEELRGIGVRVAIDDFGTGYSSLSYLGRFPLDYLKIDRSFVDGLGTDGPAVGGGHTPLVSGIARLASALGLTVVAEGVETELRARAVESLGCQKAQGYLFGRPGPAVVLTPCPDAEERAGAGQEQPLVVPQLAQT
jgi:diguanylate cyclase (GGDEF)-like protein/PAS domain S-box-containing protein